VDRDLLLGAYVEDLAVGARVIEEGEHGPDGVGHVAEATPLPPVPVDGEVLAPKRLADEAWHAHAVGSGLSRTHAIEQADDHHGNAPVASVRVSENLVDRLGRAVGP